MATNWIFARAGHRHNSQEFIGIRNREPSLGRCQHSGVNFLVRLPARLDATLYLEAEEWVSG